jgi:hypothetical protein
MNYSDRFLRETASYSVLDIMLADIAVRIQLTPTDYQKAIEHYEAINEWIDRDDSLLHGRVQLCHDRRDPCSAEVRRRLLRVALATMDVEQRLTALRQLLV